MIPRPEDLCTERERMALLQDDIDRIRQADERRMAEQEGRPWLLYAGIVLAMVGVLAAVAVAYWP